LEQEQAPRQIVGHRWAWVSKKRVLEQVEVVVEVLVNIQQQQQPAWYEARDC